MNIYLMTHNKKLIPCCSDITEIRYCLTIDARENFFIFDMEEIYRFIEYCSCPCHSRRRFDCFSKLNSISFGQW